MAEDDIHPSKSTPEQNGIPAGRGAAVVGLRASFPSFTEISPPSLRLIISAVCKIVYPTAAAAPSSERQG